MKALKTFIIITLATIVVIICSFVILYLIWIGKDPNPLNYNDKVDTLAAILALIIGTAAALGSAIAALKIAALGLDISKQQERRDNLEFLDSKVRSSQDIFSDIAITLGDIYSSSIAVDNKIPYFDGNPLNYIDSKLETELKFEVQQLADNIKHLCTSLKKILKNDFARKCYYDSVKTKNLKCAELNNQLKVLDPIETNHSIYNVDINNVCDIISLLDIAQRELRTCNMKKFIEARVFTRSSDISIFNRPYNNQSVREFFFLGNLILTITPQNDNPWFIANFGAAILHDLYYSLPNAKIMENVLYKYYPDLFIMTNNYNIDFCPQEIVSSFLEKAILDADEIGGLYLLVAKKL